MNVRKFQLELMRTILRSSMLEYDDAYQMVRALSMQMVPLIEQSERDKQALAELKKKELEEKKRELQEAMSRSIRNQYAAGA